MNLKLVNPAKHLIFVCGCSYTTYKIIYWTLSRLHKSQNIPILYTKLINYCSGKRSLDLRQSFKDLDLDIKHAQMRNHSHPDAARYRCIGNTLIDHFIISNGYEPFSISKSRTEAEHQVPGSRLYYHAKDLQMEPDFNVRPTTDQAIYKATDVDYYCKLPYYLNGKHLMLYTFVPLTAAGPTSNGTFCISKNDEIATHIDGGAHYSHKIWDYESDHFVVDHWWGASLYLVESRTVTTDRRIILFNHVRNVYGPLAWLLPGKRLKHRKLTYGNFGFIKNQLDGVINYSLNIIDTTQVATVSESVFHNAYIKYSSSSKPTMGDIERVIRSNVDDKYAAQYAAVLFQAFSHGDFVSQIIKTLPVTTVVPNTNAYYPIRPLIYDDGVPSMRVIGFNYMNDAFHPKRGVNSDEATLQGRVRDVKNANTSIPPFYVTCLNEFAQQLVPTHRVGSIVPEDYEYMYTKWDRPTQRNLLERAKHFLYNCVPKVKSFMKAEAYSKLTHPRNISTLPTEHNCRLGQFIYPMSQLLKESGWYVFGQEPSTVANMVHGMAKDARFLVPTDVSKLDGSCGAFHTRIIIAVISRAVAPIYRQEALRLIAGERSINGVTKYGLRYHVDDTTLSGSSQTAFRNSTICACLCYIALRVTGFDQQAAWKKLGVYGGDDGATPDVDPSALSNVFARTGLHLKSQIIKPGHSLPFLGRYYVDPWTTSDSIIDVPRQFRKVHLSASPASVPNSVALRRKAAGILVNDPDTPIISDWARAVLRVHKPLSNEDRFTRMTNVDTSYWSDCNNPFPTPSRDIALELVKQMFHEIGVDIDPEHWAAFFNAAKQPKDLQPPDIINVERKVEVDCIVNGELAIAPKVDSHQEKLKKTRKKNSKAVKHDKAVEKNKSTEKAVDKDKSVTKTTKTRPKCTLAPNCSRSKCRFSHE